MQAHELTRALARAFSGIVSKPWRRDAAAAGVLLGLGLACLNPHTDDQPTYADTGGSPADVAPQPEFCNDNPRLGSCGLIGSGDPTPMGAGAGGSTSSSGSGGAAGSAGSAGSAGAVGLPDNESDAGPRDAGAGDAGAGDAGAL